MVFSDITKDYKTLTDLINTQEKSNAFFFAALNAKSNYHAQLQKEVFESLTYEAKTPMNSFFLDSLLSDQIAIMNSSLRKTIVFISEIENTKFLSKTVNDSARTLCKTLNNLMDIIEEYVTNKIRNNKKESNATLVELILQLEKFSDVYNMIFEKYTSLTNIENELVEPMPLDDSESSECSYLDIRSYKQVQNIVSFTDDLKLLTNCLQNLERLAYPSGNHSIYIGKIESGSLKALFGSTKIDFSIFPDLITSISNAIQTWKLTPAEKEKTQAEAEKIKAEAQLIRVQAESQHIQNEGAKLAIINAQIDFLCEKFSLDSNNPDCIEQIQQFCHPLITYMERNPVGSFNGVDYDITKEVHLLESSNLEN